MATTHLPGVPSMCHTDGNGFPPGRVAPASLPPDEAGALVNRRVGEQVHGPPGTQVRVRPIPGRAMFARSGIGPTSKPRPGGDVCVECPSGERQFRAWPRRTPMSPPTESAKSPVSTSRLSVSASRLRRPADSLIRIRPPRSYLRDSTASRGAPLRPQGCACRVCNLYHYPVRV